MSGLDNLRTRLEYNGGTAAQDRMIQAKLNTLKKALLYSYQAQTITLSDGRKFRCLINPDKTKPDYDCKIISIPYKDICLGRDNKKKYPTEKTSKGEEEIGLKAGDVFRWDDTNTYWIVYLEKLEEKAYFRGEIYKCEEFIEINNKKYHVYIRGPVETTTQWNQKKGVNWNDLNYSLIIYITKDENTLDYFHRFKEVTIGDKNWKVKTVDTYSADGIIEVCLGEWYTNSIEKYSVKHQSKQDDIKDIVNKDGVYISGKDVVDPFSTEEYKIHNLFNGNWEIDNKKKAKIIEKTGNTVIVQIISGKSGNFNLIYNKEGEQVIFPVKIKSI
ncbi:MAG: Ig domain protein [Caudoviricetes sp.]|nr:MAG: Ig domain protein [Caudoviricetes sp.]